MHTISYFEPCIHQSECIALCSDTPSAIVHCCRGCAQAGVICYLLFLLSTSVDAFFAAKTMPTQYTAYNIAVLVSTVARGLCYLLTFIFGANATGLGVLGLQLIVSPESVAAGERRQRTAGERLPDVKITDDLLAVRKAFREAEEMGRRSAEKKGGGS